MKIYVMLILVVIVSICSSTCGYIIGLDAAKKPSMFDEGSQFCGGMYLGILGATHKAFEYNTVMECSEQFPSIKQLIDENVSAIHSNDYCVSLAMFGEYPKLDMNKATCDYYTCNPDGEMTGMVRTIIEGEK